MRKIRILGTLVHDTRGAEIAEAAAVLPLMFMILLGIFWFGQAFSIYGAITRAAQEGARAAAVPYCATCNPVSTPVANAVTAVQNTLSTANLNPNLARQPTTLPSFPSGACPIASGTPPCDGGSSNVCVQMPVQLAVASSAGATGVCGVSVSFQYPFQFWLPFTGLNNQQVWMTASARVRLENQ
jgi:Flp pilus assembly protein TadG